MKRIVSLLLLLAVVFSCVACGSSTPKTDATGYTDPSAFLKDMAKGIQKRLAAVDDEKHANDTDEQKSEYFKSLVKCELDQIDKYESAIFEDSKFNDLAHHYIHACRMQYTGAENIRSTSLYNALWNGGSTVRKGIIVTMYEQYDLPIDSNTVANYTGGSTGYTVTINSGSNTSKKEFDREAVEKKLEASYVITQNDKDVAFLKNDSEEIISAKLTTKLYHNGKLVSAEESVFRNVFPGQIAADWVYLPDLIYDSAEVEISNVSRGTLECADGTTLSDLVSFSVTKTSDNAIVECQNIGLDPSSHIETAIVFYRDSIPVWCEYAQFSVDIGKTQSKNANDFVPVKADFDDVKVFVTSIIKTS